ncbi:MAG: hypothetical protein WCA82_08620 [Jiangellales bacterium]
MIAYREPDRNPGRHSMSQPLEPLSTARHQKPADEAVALHLREGKTH